MHKLHFTPEHLTPQPTAGIDVRTTLAHFAIITYQVEPDALRQHIPPRFQLDCITTADGSLKALVSVVPFYDRDFRFVNCPWPQWSFGQTNYRAYVTDSETGQHCVWFFGTVLDSFTVNIPRHSWKLPWHRARINFDVEFDANKKHYIRYRMKATSRWAPAELELTDTGQPPKHLDGFPDLETGLVVLTHPLVGYYTRRDGRLGSYSIWHDRLQLTVGQATLAKFPLLEKLNLTHTGNLTNLHSILIQPSTEFTIYLPPAVV